MIFLRPESLPFPYIWRIWCFKLFTTCAGLALYRYEFLAVVREIILRVDTRKIHIHRKLPFYSVIYADHEPVDSDKQIRTLFYCIHIKT